MKPYHRVAVFTLVFGAALFACGDDATSPEVPVSAERVATPDVEATPESEEVPAEGNMPLPWIKGEAGREHFCLVTHSTASPYAFAAYAVANQKTYAEARGYTHVAFDGHISGAQFVDSTRGSLSSLWGGGLYWQKLTAMDRALREGLTDGNGASRRCDWAVWMDSDVIVTNPNVGLEDVVATYAQAPEADNIASVDVLLVPDDRHPVSGGVFFVRNTAIGRSFIDAVSALYPAYKDNHLPEQTAMATVAYVVEPWPSARRVTRPEASLHPAVAVLPHRAINAFPDLGRNQAAHVVWQPGDFVAHFAGVRHNQREAAMRQVMREAQQADASAEAAVAQ